MIQSETFTLLLADNDLTNWYDAFMDEANFFTIADAHRLSAHNMEQTKQVVGERGYNMLRNGLRETKQGVVQVLLPLQAYLLKRVIDSKNVSRITSQEAAFNEVVDEIIPADGVGECYRDFLKWAGHEHIRSFSTPHPRFPDLVREPNSLRITDMITDVVELDNEAGYEPTMSIAPSMQDMAYLSMCIAGEAGEIANSCKKLIRDGYSDKEMSNLEDEIVDVLIYIAKLANNAGLDLDTVWKRKFDELYVRNGLSIPDLLAHDKR